jgi:hypothetical protein
VLPGQLARRHGEAGNDWLGVSGSGNTLLGGAGNDWLAPRSRRMVRFGLQSCCSSATTASKTSDD